MPNVEETEPHLNDPTAIELLQHATREPDFEKAQVKFQKFAELNNRLTQRIALRGMLTFSSDRPPVPLDEV